MRPKYTKKSFIPAKKLHLQIYFRSRLPKSKPQMAHCRHRNRKKEILMAYKR